MNLSYIKVLQNVGTYAKSNTKTNNTFQRKEKKMIICIHCSLTYTFQYDENVQQLRFIHYPILC